VKYFIEQLKALLAVTAMFATMATMCWMTHEITRKHYEEKIFVQRNFFLNQIRQWAEKSGETQ
jgi:hypothetical protein